MISLIICSRNKHTEASLLQNISATIGTDYEIVHIDNSNGEYSIFQAYNLGVEKAKGDILCFMHEDIVFHSAGWGKVVESHMAQGAVGALGVAGGYHVAKEMDWRFHGLGLVNLIQGTYTFEPFPKYYHIYKPQHEGESLKEVCVLDGVWFCIRKELFKEIHFDEVNFHDFHMYDSDICMQINKIGKGVFVTSDVLLEHKSEGVFTEEFCNSLAVFVEKWKDVLPMTKGDKLSDDTIAKAMTNGQKLFEHRIRRDSIICNIKRKFNNGSDNTTTEFNQEEREVIEESIYDYCKRNIKDKKRSILFCINAVKDYSDSPYAMRTLSLVGKLLWYKCLRKA